MVKTYNPKEISIIIGSRALHGYSDSDFVAVDRNEDNWTLLVGADGESTRSKNANKSGRITITLLASSDSNDYLTGLAVADELSGRSTFSGLVKDPFGTTLHAFATGWIVKQPTTTFGKEAGTREWVIETDELVNYTGGAI